MASTTSTLPESGRVDGWFVLRVAAKAAVLFLALNVLWALADPLPLVGRISIYNGIVPGRQRLPFGENPESYNLSTFQLDAMFASHEIAAPRRDDEFRVLVIGDSSVWGILLRPEETIAGGINAEGLAAPDGRVVRAYNLGYPTIAVGKDLLLLNRAMRYDPDMIVWLVTLEALPAGKQTQSPIVQHNAEDMRALIAAYGLSMDPADPAFVNPTFMGRTLVGQRRALADVVRLNLYGLTWAATGIDQFYPENYTPPQNDFEPGDEDFYGLSRPLTEEALAFDVLEAGMEMAGDVPVLLINEPIFVASGQNSDVRYNAYYPRWAYDDYRALVAAHAQASGWRYLDLWDAFPLEDFTNSAIHLNPGATRQLAHLIGEAIAAYFAE